MNSDRREHPSFISFLEKERKKIYFKEIIGFLFKTNKEIICPNLEDIFRSFSFFDFQDLRIVILGQDPYHQKDVADGLAFSTKHQKTPASLKNIFKELIYEFPEIKIKSNDLSCWAKQGILLQNTFLTTELEKARAHSFLPWKIFTMNLIEYINTNLSNVIFLLWGNDAKEMKCLIDSTKHFILESSHPSPLSFYKGFFKNNHFVKVNEILKANNLKQIDWNIF
ncbi:uracil-DNA glycosylase [[Mycoplasma] mobile]|uniref:Uracil-DNA glycosylase n=1 Tax=Mycoplasma mobile (strain ATCC 43663 / 163K / NCTC 11711) TaxID=267748 RepID=Q6KIL8_MYCM1|nr:uracil-DNA glycosylase [[Mycoplasma] mobile]AAT27558.1 uracil-DNA glycosylase [Mycoplasma mobile 163K]